MTSNYSNSECSICNNEYNHITLKPFVITPCGHMYCEVCLQKIETDKNECPECRTHIANRVVCRLVLDLIADIQLKNKQLDAKNKLDQMLSLASDLEKMPAINPTVFVQQYFKNGKKNKSKNILKTH